jgi:hypothetical protein
MAATYTIVMGSRWVLPGTFVLRVIQAQEISPYYTNRQLITLRLRFVLNLWTQSGSGEAQ